MAEENKKAEGEMEHTETLIEKLHKASTEINTMKDSFSKYMNNLEKIQGMLDLDNINQFTSTLEDYETRISEAERKREEAAEGARKYSEELEKEKERLMKLWDAYKNQEEELSSREKRASELEEKFAELEQSKKQLEEDLTKRITTLSQKLEETEQNMQQMGEYKQKVQEFDTIRNNLENEVQTLRTDSEKKDAAILALQEEVDSLKQYESYVEYKDKYEDISKEYEKEKERLTKLFRLYEETEAECTTMKQEIKEWQSWFDANQELFNKLFSSADHLRKNIIKNIPSEEKTSEPKSETTSSQKKTKKKLRFKK